MSGKLLRCGTLAFCLLLLSPAAYAADANQLVRDYNQAVSLVQSGRYADGRQKLTEVVETCQAVMRGDPAYQKAQELLKLAPQLKQESFIRSYNEAKKQTEKTLQSLQFDQALGNGRQAERDLQELILLEPENKDWPKRLASVREQMAQTKIVRSLEQSKPIDDGNIKRAGLGAPELLHASAPEFTLPLWNGSGLVRLADFPGQAVVLQWWKAGDSTAEPAVKSLQVLKKKFANQPVQWVSVSLDEGRSLEKLKSLLRTHQPDWPFALDDRGECSRNYLRRHYLPSYTLITRDRRVLWFTSPQILKTTAAIAVAVAQELQRDVSDLPTFPIAYAPEVRDLRVSPTGKDQTEVIRFHDKPTILLLTDTRERPEVLKPLVEFARRHDSSLQVVIAVFEQNPGDAARLAGKLSFPLAVLKSALPAELGRDNLKRIVFISSAGRVMKMLPLGFRDAPHADAVLERYANLLLTPQSLPREMRDPVRTNLAGRSYGGRIVSVSSSAKPGSEQLLNDGRIAGDAWRSKAGYPHEVVLSFLNGEPATFDRLLIDRQSPVGAFEVFAGETADNATRLLGRFRFQDRDGLQAFALPETTDCVLRIRFTSAATKNTAQNPLEIGEIMVGEAAAVQPTLSERVQRFLAREQSLSETFDASTLLFWKETEFFPSRSSSGWQLTSGQLRHTEDLPFRELRGSALIHKRPAVKSFHLQAVFQGTRQFAGLVFGFQDWDNHDRLVLVRGSLQTGSGNSIRLERWRDGQLEMLGGHGEGWPFDKPIQLEVLRQGSHLIIKAQDQVILAGEDSDPLTGQVGVTVAGSGDVQVDNFQMTPLDESGAVPRPEINPLSTAAGTSIVWLSSQGQHPDTLASNLLRIPVFSQPGRWEATAMNGEPPEVVFAFRNHREVTLKQIGFAIPDAKGGAEKNRVRKIEVLVSRDPQLRPSRFRSVGTYALDARSGLQRFSLDQPVTCRFLMLRLLENDGGDRYSLARVDVELDEEPSSVESNETQLTERTQVEQSFGKKADITEQEPNDTLDQGTPLINGRECAGVIQSGEVDWYRLPAPPTTGVTRVLTLRLRGLPWLRVTAYVMDEQGQPLGPPLAAQEAGQQVEQTRSIVANQPVPKFIRVKMPAPSTALVLDLSGSMHGRENDVQTAAQTYLNTGTAEEVIEVIRFSDKVQVVGRLPEDRQKVLTAVSKLRMAGNTALYSALLTAMKRNQAVVLLSDGMNTDPQVDFPALCRELRRHPVPIYVIGLGWDLYEFDPHSGNTAIGLLQNLARQTGGRFFFAPDSQQLEELYREIAAEIRSRTRYRLLARWQTTQRTLELAMIPQGTLPRTPRPLRGDLPTLRTDITLQGSPGPAQLILAAIPHPPTQLDYRLPVRRGDTAGVQQPIPISMESSVASPSPQSVLSDSPLPVSMELAEAHLPASVPFSASLPKFGQISLSYRAGPDADDVSLLPASVLPAYLILYDSSGSMKEPVDGKAKHRIAEDVLKQVMKDLPKQAQVGMRIFGYWGVWINRRTDPNADPVPTNHPLMDKDSFLVVPIAPLTTKHRESINAWINSAKPLGKTPMFYSLLEGRKDFPQKWKGPRTVILLSDGMETCGGKMEDVKHAYRNSDLRIIVHVIGFDIRDADAERQLRTIARETGGKYLPANNTKELTEAFKEAIVSTEYVIEDADQKVVVARGFINGKPVDLPAGRYRVRLSDIKSKSLSVEVEQSHTVQLELTDQGELRHDMDSSSSDN